MRVGLVCPYSLDVHGGVQNHVLQLAVALKRLGHEVAVLAPGEGRVEVPSYVTTTGRAVALRHNGSVARVSFGPLVAARVGRWLAAGDFDILHLHEPATPSVSALALWAVGVRSGPVRVVATSHTAQDRAWALRASAVTLLRSGLDRISAHIAVSVEARNTLARYSSSPARVIPNGVQVSRFTGPGERARDGSTVAFVGRLDEPRKGLATLLAALPAISERHPSVRLHVVGAGAVPPRLPVRAGRVELMGALSDEGKARVLAEADVLVAPNTGGESFGVVLIEAMAAGAAVVASDLPAFRRVLGDGAHGDLCPPGDPAALARRVGDLLADEPRRHRLAAAAGHAVGAYDWSVVAPRVAELYAEVHAGGSKQGPPRRTLGRKPDRTTGHRAGVRLSA